MKLLRTTPNLKFFVPGYTFRVPQKCAKCPTICSKCTAKYYEVNYDFFIKDFMQGLGMSASLCFATGIILSAYANAHKDTDEITEMSKNCFIVAFVLMCACAFCFLFM